MLGAVIVIGGVAAVVVVVSRTAPTETTLGNALVMAGGGGAKARITVRVVDPATPIPGANPAPSDTHYVVAVLSVQNIGHSSIDPYEPDDVSLNDGDVQGTPVGVTQCTPTDAAIAPGDTGTVCDTFEVADGSTISDVQVRFSGSDETDTWDPTGTTS